VSEPALDHVFGAFTVHHGNFSVLRTIEAVAVGQEAVAVSGGGITFVISGSRRQMVTRGGREVVGSGTVLVTHRLKVTFHIFRQKCVIGPDYGFSVLIHGGLSWSG